MKTRASISIVAAVIFTGAEFFVDGGFAQV
jgi:hypothetical protein